MSFNHTDYQVDLCSTFQEKSKVTRVFMSLCDKEETLLQDINQEKTYSEANQSNRVKLVLILFSRV